MMSGVMDRGESLRRLRERNEPWDVLVIGGGATGVGVALDAASRGLQVALVEQSDFGKGTSSRSTKLVHGGVRYLRQGNITLVRDALRERSLLQTNAPHLVHDTPFLIPCQSLWDRFFYWIGLKLYDLLAGRSRFGRSQGVSASTALERVPVLQLDRLRGGVVYHDGQFDDARLLINMAQTANENGACLTNYLGVVDLVKSNDGNITGVELLDHESGDRLTVNSRCVVNAAGPFCDAIRQLDDANCETMIATSQGIHLVLPRHFFPGETALIVPKTPDGRVIFIIPWHDHTIIGTTDTPIDEAVLEPTPQRDEIEYLLKMSANYLATSPQLEDVLSIYTGIRPLVKGDKSANTASLSRDHVIRVTDSGLITITGGKWTTVRKMAEDCVDRVIKETKLNSVPSPTATIPIHGASLSTDATQDRSYYGSDLETVLKLEQNDSRLAEPLHESLTIRRSDIVWAVRNEMARTIDDVLSRRTRSLFVNARAAMKIAPEVAREMAKEMKLDHTWVAEQVEQFESIAKHYLPPEMAPSN